MTHTPAPITPDLTAALTRLRRKIHIMRLHAANSGQQTDVEELAHLVDIICTAHGHTP